jgi:hypothetical protein
MKKRLIPCIIIIPLSEVDRNKTKFDDYLETSNCIKIYFGDEI